AGGFRGGLRRRTASAAATGEGERCEQYGRRARDEGPSSGVDHACPFAWTKFFLRQGSRSSGLLSAPTATICGPEQPESRHSCSPPRRRRVARSHWALLTS